MKYTRLIDIIAITALILSAVEKEVSVLAQMRFATITEANSLPATLFQKVGLIEGHIILFIISAVAIIAIRIGAVNFASKIANPRQRQICLDMLFIALVAIIIGFMATLVNNISILTMHL